MPREPVRFIHAARLSLDHQLQGLCALPAEWRETVRDATLTAFQRVIDACLEHHVDFLLLTGDSFDARDGSLRAQAMLAKGLSRLAEHGIPTYVCAGALDPWESWLPQIRLPSTVHTLGETGGEALANVHRGSHTIAAIRWLTRDDLASSTPAAVEQPGCFAQESTHVRPLPAFAVGVSYLDATDKSSSDGSGNASELSCSDIIRRLGINYWGLGGAGDAGTTSDGALTLHRPGPAQGTSAADSGICGCTLVDVTAEGKTKITRLPTAPVRWERLEVQVSAGMSPSDVLAVLRAAYERLEPIPAEKLRLASWEIKSDGPLPACLADERARDQVLELWQHDVATPRVGAGSLLKKASDPLEQAPFAEEHRSLERDRPLFQQVALSVPVHTVAIRCHGSTKHETANTSDTHLRHDYRHRLDTRLTDRSWSPARCLAGSALSGGPWQAAMEAVVATLDPDDVARESRQRADKWFDGAEELST